MTNGHGGDHHGMRRAITANKAHSSTRLRLARKYKIPSRMETTWRLLDPWCRQLRGVVEAVPMEKGNVSARLAASDSLDNLWELRVLLPRPSTFSLQGWSQADDTISKEMKKLQAIREALDLLWLVHCADEKAWTWILVHRCGVGGFELPAWTDDAKILPTIRLQPFYADVIDELLESLEQCYHLLVHDKDESQRSEMYLAAHRELKSIVDVTGDLPRHSYSVAICNCMSPRTQLNAIDSNKLWHKLHTFTRLFPSRAEGTQWRVQSLDVHLSRMVLTFDASQVVLGLIKSRIAIGELWIDLIDREGDEFTANGACAVLSKLFSSESRPQTLRVDCENASIPRLQALSRLLTVTNPPGNVVIQRVGLSSHATKSMERAEIFNCLGVCLVQSSIRTLRLDIPELSLDDVSSLTAATKSFDRSSSTPGLLSLALAVDCQRESWTAMSKLVSEIGYKIHALEIEINGDVLPDTAPRYILDACTKLEYLTLHRLQLGVTNPFVDNSKPTLRLQSLTLPRLHAPLHVVSQFSQSIADGRRTKRLQSLDVDLSEVVNVCDEIVDGFGSALRENTYMTHLTLTLDTEAAAAISDRVHDDFYHLHNERLLQPLRLHQKLAFLSVLKDRSANPPLSQLPVSLIFEYAACQTRRRVCIREPGTLW